MNQGILHWVLVVLASALIGGVSGAAVNSAWDKDPNAAAVQQAAPTPIPGQLAPGVADLYASVRPSVVRIVAVSTSTGQGGTGSGVVLDKHGDIATNYHVVNGFNQLDVKLADGTDVSAQVVGWDPGDDLAVVKIDVSPDKLSPVELGDSSTVKVGDAVIAIGNPFDLEATLTEGVVSGIGRILSDGNARPLRELIQTDTAINPGNSGGGLFNLNGELIGITNAIENPSGQDVFVGIGYAIPVNTLKSYLPQMLAGKTISHARLGLSLQDLTPAVANSLGIKVRQGVLVQAVDPNSGAARAGLRGTSRSQPGDVIVAIDGHDAKTFEDLAGYVDTKKVGDKVELKIDRGGSEVTLSVTLDAWTS
ncbi:MAG TPA: trypsin-like peptidase domain-containing protein [Dehalococcoidia bacterium]|nr:trypsin-like peptidase domain-containing protein [Dehalococcoidia bacterium]